MNISDTGLNKKAQAILKTVDSFIATFSRNKGCNPEKLALKQADYDAVYKCVAKESKKTPESLERHGVKIYPLGGVK